MRFRYIPCSLDNQTQSQLPSVRHQASLKCTHCCSRCCLERLRVRAALGLLGLPFLGVDGRREREEEENKKRKGDEWRGHGRMEWKVVREGRGSVCNWTDLGLAARPHSADRHAGSTGTSLQCPCATFLHLTHRYCTVQLETYTAPQQTTSHMSL